MFCSIKKPRPVWWMEYTRLIATILFYTIIRTRINFLRFKVFFKTAFIIMFAVSTLLCHYTNFSIKHLGEVGCWINTLFFPCLICAFSYLLRSLAKLMAFLCQLLNISSCTQFSSADGLFLGLGMII